MGMQLHRGASMRCYALRIGREVWAWMHLQNTRTSSGRCLMPQHPLSCWTRLNRYICHRHLLQCATYVTYSLIACLSCCMGSTGR